MASKGNKLKLVFLSFITIAVTCVVLVFGFENPVGNFVLSEAKAKGYMEYEPYEAYTLAHDICTQCHSTERIKLYCPRCGPPFIAVVPHMQTFIDNYKQTKPNLKFENVTEYQAVAIVQVWNALVGNWEGDFREQDILKLIGHYDILKEFYKTPVKDRHIEYALSNRDDLKIGHMSNIMDAQKNLGKPENNPGPSTQEKPSMKEHDHSEMNHEGMEH